MVLPSYTAQAPGSLMLMGEYAVLRGFPAIVTAIKKYIQVTLTPRTDDAITIDSTLGQFSTTLSQLTVTPPFEYVLTTLKNLKIPLNTGCSIHINSEFSSQMGLGSSAAVTVALLAALYRWQGQTINHDELYQDALATVQAVQGNASGADIAASIYGGIIEFYRKPRIIKTLPPIPWLTVIYTGAKTTTTEALARMQQQEKKNPALYQSFFIKLGQLSQASVTAIRQADWLTLGKYMNEAQKVLVKMDVSTPAIDLVVSRLLEQINILGAKISGAGLGDCVIGLGKIAHDFFPENKHQQKVGIQQLDIDIAAPGVSCAL